MVKMLISECVKLFGCQNAECVFDNCEMKGYIKDINMIRRMGFASLRVCHFEYRPTDT